MKIVLLGAGGLIGREAARLLVRRGRVEEIVLADLTVDVVSDLASERVQVRAVDAEDAPFGEILETADLLLNCTTYHLGLRMLEAAIAAGVDYVDLGGLYNTPLQLAMSARAAEAGTTAVLGCGATPGLSNLMALDAAGELDEVHDVEISFASFRDLAPSAGLLDTVLDEFRPDVRRYYWSNGGLVDVAAFSGRKAIDFPPPIGRQEVFYVPHSENHTLPGSLDGVSNVSVRGTWRPEDMQSLRLMAEVGMTSDDPVAISDGEVAPLEVLRSVLLQRGKVSDDGSFAFYLHVEARGKKAGADATCSRVATHPDDWGPRSTALMTAVPAVVAAELLVQGHSPGPGVFPPERALDPAQVFAAVRHEGVEVRAASPAEVVSTTH